MKVLSLAALILVSVACNNAAPTATAYKEQLGAPAAVTGGNNTPTGDAAKGQTALAACTGCHADGGAAHKLVAADADSIGNGDAGKNPIHNSVPQAAKDAFKNNSLDMAVFLKGGSTGGTTPAGGDAAAGEALLKAQCEGCHNPDGTGMGPVLDQFANLAGQEAKPIHAGVAASFTDATKKADIEAALKARK
ncbi:MAG TPA: c-type cytochrome [Oligoflexus sp.]|uniref:c-type cytochrome n=1 Tax=Oligoflexus sp. TaxID=1971216 RepID=UPI002D80C60B|nr:c-type cytochrome [Oligoflexus sp.]HET9239413.1 c-type cytochrome [Oligoflexus sp.]